jgi:OOP family OmpA-OmpF porin
VLAALMALAAPVGAAWGQGGAAPAGTAPARGDQPVRPLPPPATPPKTELVTRSASLPARGLFEGDRLTPQARERLTELVIDAIGRHVEVALLMPTGPWRTDGSGRDERDLTPARIEAVRAFLALRGLDPKRIFVESRIDEKLREPRLDVQIIDRPAND